MKIGNYNVQVDANGDLIEWEDDEFIFDDGGIETDLQQALFDSVDSIGQPIIHYDEDAEDDDEFIGQMCSCDISGICGGPSCPQYYYCQF
jgi:hypothetical protein